MATIGYVSVEDATIYVAEHYISTDPMRALWTGLSTEDKEVLLRKSFECIERLPFTGRKTDKDQPNAFPRFPNTTVPTSIVSAQVENALSLADPTSSEDAAFYQKLWQYGVEEYKIGNLSERTSTGAWGNSLSAASGIVSAKALSLLQPYLRGSFRISRRRLPYE